MGLSALDPVVVAPFVMNVFLCGVGNTSLVDCAINKRGSRPVLCYDHLEPLRTWDIDNVRPANRNAMPDRVLAVPEMTFVST